ncbi:helix-turn-helix transcriptional regulator [Pseudoflavonifractor phocaeensis]|nr:helix-turn-helix transcriptional regulator [Pseudoflavonifractor phocaeensis]
MAFSTDTGIHFGFCVKSHFFSRVWELYYIRHIITTFRDQCITVQVGKEVTICSKGVSFTPNDFSKTVGRKIRDLRKLYGLTQSELGGRIGSPSITVRQWEAGKRLPKLQMLCKVADALGVPVSSLLPEQKLVEWDRQKTAAPGCARPGDGRKE